MARRKKKHQKERVLEPVITPGKPIKVPGKVKSTLFRYRSLTSTDCLSPTITDCPSPTIHDARQAQMSKEAAGLRTRTQQTRSTEVR